ncbi:rho-related GTP-binding protein RhoN-like isoform X1 [Myxocyprinus asiaticus]|uniref:rho-related GTP-binding protein RhoN-like isoform X1 n=1 Tax=Myxocyprinus asiaticus TaxID=70543 RepID=UPI0022223C90|nr:rho-related GTP-binding protein RhoN-like isoform X1 [Myxocyprinus asiaticus]
METSRCKIVVVGDMQCGKTALLHVFAKDSYPEKYVPTVFENYTASFEIDKQRIELTMWDTSEVGSGIILMAASLHNRSDWISTTLQLRNRVKLAVSALPFITATYVGSSYYDNVRPLAYTDSDAILICFDISRPDTLDSVLKKWLGKSQEFCPSAKIVLVGCKLDKRTDLHTLRELSKHTLIPVTHEQGASLARQIGAVAYTECTSRYSENSVRDVFHVTTVASVTGIQHPAMKRYNSCLKQVPQHPQCQEILDCPNAIRKVRSKSCTLM